MKSFKTIEAYIEAHGEWIPALTKLRKVLLSTELVETVKWGGPCYTLDGKNVVGLGAYANHAALWFHQGVFLEDPAGVLVNAQEGKTVALRQMRFETLAQIKVRLVKAYLEEAIENQKLGKVVKPKKASALRLPSELAAALRESPKLKQAFEALTPGRRREYGQYITEAKREATRLSRVEKITPMIQSGVGLNDRYR